MSYNELPQSVEDQRSVADEAAVSLLPTSTTYQAYRTLNASENPDIASKVRNTPILVNSSYSTRLPTPPVIHPISWPGIVPSRQQSPTSSLGFQSKLFGNHNNQPYEENLPWANSTHFRCTSSSTNYDFTSLLEDTRPSKQYFRNARRIREPWRAGNLIRFPWSGVGALFLVLLLTGSSTTIIFTSATTAPSTWQIQPPTYLSILELFMCIFTLYAFSRGVVISFWATLLHGATLGDIYESVSPSASMGQLGKLRWKKLGVASLFALLSLARGPLLQRALILKNNTYNSSIVFVILGILVSMVGVIAILPLYHGYQDLGRVVSLHPLEIARAFGAPLFDGMDGNVSAMDVEMEKGRLVLRYGAVERNGEEKVLRVEDVGKVSVRMPRAGEIFG